MRVGDVAKVVVVGSCTCHENRKGKRYLGAGTSFDERVDERGDERVDRMLASVNIISHNSCIHLFFINI